MPPLDAAKKFESLKSLPKRNPKPHDKGASELKGGRKLARRIKKNNPLPEENRESKPGESRSKSTREAIKRLQTIQEYSELGSGYKIAMRDLEIRGTGDILGTRQHGHCAPGRDMVVVARLHHSHQLDLTGDQQRGHADEFHEDEQ